VVREVLRSPPGPPHFYVLVGVPGSGKTTYAREHLPRALRISLDDLRLMFTGRTFDARVESAVAVAGDALKESLAAFAASKRVDLVHDATNVSRGRRAALIATASRHGLIPVAIYLPVSLALALDRNRLRPFPVPSQAIRRFVRILVPPSRDEGFAEIVTVEPEEGDLEQLDD
jgi:predicted kinase